MESGERMFREARELIEIESTSGFEAACMDRAEQLIRDSGLPVKTIPVAPGRRNLLAGPPGARVLLCTHLDTVPPYIPYSEDGEFLHGRGSCDAKGIAAAMLEGARRLLQDGIRDFGLLFLVGEEVDHAGASAANARVRCEHLIVGEPTRNLLARGHKGALSLRLQVEGIAAHSAYPEQGKSAIHRLLDVLERIRRVDFGEDPILGPATLNVGQIGGGVAANVLAPGAWALVMFRVVLPLKEVERRIQECLQDRPGGNQDRKLSIQIINRMPPTHTCLLEGIPLTVVSFGTDIPFLKDVGKPYLIGPGDILHAHTGGEKVARRDLLEGAAIYHHMVRRLLESPAP